MREGNTFYLEGNYVKSLEYFDQILQVDPEYIDVLNNKGLALGKLGRYDEAITWYDKALEIEPENIDVLANKSNAVYELGKLKRQKF